ncbi:MAG: DUF433 domain-containing protein [Ignavibacteriae bacterium]|nr:DUF433 domain-containing protein [Ignavibacteriota bacterium]
MEADLLSRVEINPKIMFGKPVIGGTRLTVELVLEKLAQGYTHEKLIGEYPFLTEEGIRASLMYAAKSLSVSGIV